MKRSEMDNEIVKKVEFLKAMQNTENFPWKSYNISDRAKLIFNYGRVGLFGEPDKTAVFNLSIGGVSLKQIDLNLTKQEQDKVDYYVQELNKWLRNEREDLPE